MTKESNTGAGRSFEPPDPRPETLLDALGEPLLLLDVDGRILHGNPAAERFLGECGVLRDRLLVDLLAGGPGFGFGPACGERCQEPVEFMRAEGGAHPGFVDLKPLTEEGKPLRYLCHLRPLLPDFPGQDTFHALFESALDLIFIKDTGGRYIAVNPAMAEAFSSDCENLVGLTTRAIFDEETCINIDAEDVRILAGDRIEKTRARMTEGSARSYHVVKVPLRDAEGGIYGICGIARDITHQLELEQEVLDASQHLQSVVDNLPGVLFSYVRNLDGSLSSVYRSPTFDALIGPENASRVRSGEIEYRDLVHPDDLGDGHGQEPDADGGGKSLQDDPAFSPPLGPELAQQLDNGAPDFPGLVHPDDRSMSEEIRRDEETGHLLYVHDYRVHVDSGEYKWVQARSRGIPQTDGAVLWHGILVDVDVHKHAEEQLRLYSRTLEQNVHSLNEAKVQAESAVQAKGQFMANMSHEIRTPLTAVLGFADILADRLGDEESLNAVSVIQRNGQHLLRIINDLLDFAKIEAGHIDLTRENFDPVAALHEVVKLMNPRVLNKDLELKLEMTENLPTAMTGDATRLRQILINLIGNALKFTESGAVTVRAGLRDDVSPTLGIEVCDTGIGMHPDEIDQLFEAFIQADSSSSRAYGGAGLGLAISKHLAELMGGALTVNSQPGMGSSFLLTLPVNKETVTGTTKVVEPVAPPEHLAARILLAEDNFTNQRIVELILNKAGSSVDIAVNGLEALAMVAAAREAGTPYDAVLMDIQMPEMDGYNATRALRDRSFRQPIIALTAHALPADRQHCLDAGCDDHIAKPIDSGELLAKLTRHIEGSKAAGRVARMKS